MKDLLDSLEKIHRPRLLIQAARIGAATYQRDMHLRRLLHGARVPVNAEALEQVMQMEEQMNQDRRSNVATYCAADHVDLLIAMMGEARLLKALFMQSRDDIHENAVRRTL